VADRPRASAPWKSAVASERLAAGPFAPRIQGLASLVDADAFAGELTRGSFKTIPARVETTNTQRQREDSWLSDLDSNQD
jgi:hypothetical protein